MKTMYDTYKVIIDIKHFVCFHREKKQKKLGSIIKTNQVCITTQVSALSSYYIWAFINSLS
jgi:hypothetical protein